MKTEAKPNENVIPPQLAPHPPFGLVEGDKFCGGFQAGDIHLLGWSISGEPRLLWGFLGAKSCSGQWVQHPLLTWSCV